MFKKGMKKKFLLKGEVRELAEFAEIVIERDKM
jgi:hypothetical protein